MHDWRMDGWGMGFGFIFWLLILAVVIAGVVCSSVHNSIASVHQSAGLPLLMCLKSVIRAETLRERSISKRNATSLVKPSQARIRLICCSEPGPLGAALRALYFINVIGTSAKWMTLVATEPSSRP
jgi:hypothetical protein